MKYKSITASPPGWWAVYQDGDEELWSSVAAWVIGANKSDEDGEIVGINPCGEGWIGGEGWTGGRVPLRPTIDQVAPEGIPIPLSNRGNGTPNPKPS